MNPPPSICSPGLQDTDTGVTLPGWTRAFAEYVAIRRWGEAEAVVIGCGVTLQAEKSTTRPPRMTMIVFQRIAITTLLLHLADTWG